MKLPCRTKCRPPCKRAQKTVSETGVKSDLAFCLRPFIEGITYNGGEYILLFALLGGEGGGFVHSGGSELEGEGGGRKWSAGAIRSEYVVRTGEGRSMCRICGKIYSKSSPAVLHVLVKVNSKKDCALLEANT